MAAEGLENATGLCRHGIRLEAGSGESYPMGLLWYLKIPFHYYYCWERVCRDILESVSNANDIWEAGAAITH